MSDSLVRIRASSLADLFDCAARWKAVHLEGRSRPSTPPAEIGTAVHKATAVFDQARLDSDPVSLDDAASVAVDAIAHPENEVDWSEMHRRDAEKIAVRLTTTYCSEVSPLHEFVAVEERLKPIRVAVGHGITLELTGTRDRVRRLGGQLGVGDVKTGKNVVAPDGSVDVRFAGAQMAVYELEERLLARDYGVELATLPVIIFGLNTSKNARVGVGHVHRPSDVLTGSPEEPGLLHYAGEIIGRDLFVGNPRSKLCHPKYCPAWNGCRWRFAGEPTNEEDL